MKFAWSVQWKIGNLHGELFQLLIETGLNQLIVCRHWIDLLSTNKKLNSTDAKSRRHDYINIVKFEFCRVN